MSGQHRQQLQSCMLANLTMPPLPHHQAGSTLCLVTTRLRAGRRRLPPSEPAPRADASVARGAQQGNQGNLAVGRRCETRRRVDSSAVPTGTLAPSTCSMAACRSFPALRRRFLALTTKWTSSARAEVAAAAARTMFSAVWKLPPLPRWASFMLSRMRRTLCSARGMRSMRRPEQQTKPLRTLSHTILGRR